MKKYWGTILIIGLLFACKNDNTEKENTIDANAIAVIEKPVQKKYGFNLDDFTVAYDTVRNGDSFGELMIKNKVDYPKIYKV